MNDDLVRSVLEGVLKRQGPSDVPTGALPAGGGGVEADTAAFAQDALKVARDPDMDASRFDPSVLFPPEG